MKKIKERKQMISFLLSICMIITMIPLNAFASSVASASDFTYDTPEDITIYKNETEVVILMDYGYTYENGNDYKKCNLETISASSNNRNIEIRQPEQSEKESGWKMKVKGLSEGTSTVTLQYSWKYNGVKKTGTSSFKVTVRAYQYCWKLDGDYDYLEDEYDSDTSNLYINESKTWDITLKKIYYKENGKRAKQLIKNFDISTKVYRRVEDDSSYDYQDIVDNSLLSVNIDKVNNTVTVTGKKEAEAYLDIQVKYQGEIINRENSEEEENKKGTLVFNVIKDSYTILCNSSAYVPMREGEGWTKDSYVSVGEKKKLTFQLMHFYYDKASERRKSEILSDAEIKAYILEEGDEENIRTELTNVAKTFEHSEMSFTNNVLTVKGIKSGGYYDREEQVNLDAYISGKKVYSSYAIFEIYEKNSKSMGSFPDINSYDQEYKENFAHIEKNTNKKISIGRFEVDDSSWNKNTPYKVDSIEVASSNPSVATASVPKMDEDGDYFLTLKGKNSGSTIITFNYTYTVGGSVNTGSQKVEVLVGQPAKTYYQLKFESIGNGIFEENGENSDYSYSLEMPSPYKTKLKAKLYEVNRDDDGNITQKEINNFTLKCKEYEYQDEDEKRGTIKVNIDNANHTIEFTGESQSCCIYELECNTGNSTDKSIYKYINVYSSNAYYYDDNYYEVEGAGDSWKDAITLKEGETFPINIFHYDNEHPNGIKVDDCTVKMKTDGKCLGINKTTNTVTAKQAGFAELSVEIESDNEDNDYDILYFYIIPRENEYLSLGKEEQLKEDGDTLTFIPEKTGTYKLLEIFKNAVMENISAYINVFDSEGNYIEGDTGSERYANSLSYCKTASTFYNLEKGKTYYFSYGKLHSYNGESGSSSDKFNTSPEKIRLSYIEDDNQECNHVWDSGVVIKAPTETTTGIKIYTCKICAETKKEIVPSTGKKEDKDSSSNNNNRQDNKSTLAPGTKITDQSSKAVYKITGKNTVEYVKCNVNKNKVSIPQKIMINGVSYQVTSIAAKAFKANKKIRSIVIPSTIRKIGKQAFLNCKNLKKITLKTSYLSKKAIGEKAFKGIHKKATIKVPKKQKKAYQKLLKSKGVGKKAKIK